MKHSVFLSHVTWSQTETEIRLQGMNQDEQQQALRYTHPLRLRSFVASRLLLKQALNLLNHSQKEWLFRKTNGRLVIEDSTVNWHISLSHTNDHVACLLSPQVHCGIDLEQRTDKPPFLAIAQRFFSVNESFYLQQLDEDQAFTCFLDWWTRKEACIKAWHVGIAHHLASIEFSPNQLSPIRFPISHQHLPLTLHTIASQDWQLACAVHDTDPEWHIQNIAL